MRLPRVRITSRWIKIGLAVVGLFLLCRDVVNVPGRADAYRRKAESAARLERRCRQIDAMDPAAREREAETAFDFDWVLLTSPDVNKRMIRYWADLRMKYEYAADHPRVPVAPDPPAPWTDPPEPK
jgi:hypothetical protein